jgi:hypothetical protein
MEPSKETTTEEIVPFVFDPKDMIKVDNFDGFTLYKYK